MGPSNVILTNGEVWKRQSSIVREAFSLALPIDLFACLARNLFQVIESSGGQHAFTLFHTESQCVTDYNRMMHDITEPPVPVFEWIFPRQKVRRIRTVFFKGFNKLLEAKCSEPGEDIIPMMLKHPELSHKQFLDDITALFLAGYDTTSGAMSSLVYYLAIVPHVQEAAREVLRVLGTDAEPSVDSIKPQSLPFLIACIREALRVNPPGAYITPRISPIDVTLGKYRILAHTLLVCNVYALHDSKAIWSDPEVFRPARFHESNTSEVWNGREPWYSFSTGARQCPAYNFALYKLRTLVVLLLQRYEWCLPQPSIHTGGLKNGFSAFALTLLAELDITFSTRSL
ncbi:cytochrome P450 [Suillus ampliporus]|nr:cytochrome P450 [Suillus ampliporus]